MRCEVSYIPEKNSGMCGKFENYFRKQKTWPWVKYIIDQSLRPIY